MLNLNRIIDIQVNAGKVLGHLPHNWTYIGYDEINYTYTPEGQELLAKFSALNEQTYYVRTHHLLCTGNCHGAYKWGSTNAYLEDENGQPLYDWTFIDLVFDTLLQHNCKPFVELGFMPQHLADPAYYDITQDTGRNQNYQAYGFAAPPKDYQRWYDLIFNLVKHCIDRYGSNEVRTWYWELWNEPDLNYYWKGSIEEFNKLYDYTAAAVKAALPEARVGGPGTTNPNPTRYSGEFLDTFLNHCVNGTNAYTHKTGTPLDFLSFHVKGGGYRTDHLRRTQNPPSVQRILDDTLAGYEIISQYPGLTDLECVLSEIDPDGWAAGGAWDNVNLNFRNTEYYPSFVVSAFDKVSRFARAKNWDLRLLSWAFLFVGERCFEGTRTFSTQGIDKAILNLFRMYAQMGQQSIGFVVGDSSDSKNKTDTDTTQVSGFATLSSDRRVEMLVYNHHDDWEYQPDVTINITLANLPFAAGGTIIDHYRIDHDHSNAYAEWIRQGQPMYPTEQQHAAIKARDALERVKPPQLLSSVKNTLNMRFNLPTHGISLLVIAAPDNE